MKTLKVNMKVKVLSATIVIKNLLNPNPSMHIGLKCTMPVICVWAMGSRCLNVMSVEPQELSFSFNNLLCV